MSNGSLKWPQQMDATGNSMVESVQLRLIDDEVWQLKLKFWKPFQWWPFWRASSSKGAFNMQHDFAILLTSFVFVLPYASIFFVLAYAS